MKKSVLSNLWRIGPNPVLTLFIWLMAGIQAVSFNIRSEVFLVGVFQLLLFCSLLWFWGTVSWAVWGALKGCSYIRTPIVRRFSLLLVCLGFYLLAILYFFGWAVFSQIHVFPDVHWLMFLRTSYAVVFYELQRQAPLALPLFGLASFILGILFPTVLPKLMRLRGEGYQTIRHFQISFLAWIVVGGLSLVAFAAVRSKQDLYVRQMETTRYVTAVDPVITMIASLVSGNEEIIKPDLDISKLTPIVEKARLYRGDEGTTSSFNVLYLAVESMRGDLLYQVHQGKEITPNLNALAKRSVVFSNMYAQATHTDYALPSFLDSQYPLRIQGHYYYQRKETWPKTLIYDHLHYYGYKTGIISSDTTNWGDVRNHLWSDKLDVFFDAENLPTTFTAGSKDKGYISDFRATPRTQIKSVPDREVVDYDMAWLEEAFTEGRPVFLHSFFYQPHYPYTLPKGVSQVFHPSTIDFESNFLWFPQDKLEVMRNAYFNAVHETDAQLGRLIRFVEDQGQMDNTVIVITADHGEAFNEHGKVTHAGPLYNEAAHIPCIIYAPGLAPRVEDYPVQHIDIAPTVCSILGIAAHPGFQGIDVLSDVRPALEDREIYLHAEPPASWRGDALLYAGRWKLWHDRYVNLYYLFDLQNDPGEYFDVIKKYPRIASELKKRLQSWRRDQLSYYAFQSYHDHYYPPKK